MNRSLKTVFFLIAFLLFQSQSLILKPALAESELSLFFARYDDNANLSVSSPTVSLLHWLNDFFSIKARYNYEVFEKTSDSSGATNPDAISGATTVVGGTGSGFEETRKESSLNINYKEGDWNASVGTIVSNEAHFESVSLLTGLGHEFFNKNFAINANYAFTTDKVIISNLQTGVNDKNKKTHSFTLSASQLLSQTQVISFGTGVAFIDGYQSGPLRKISVDEMLNGTIISYPYDERHPDHRERYLGYAQYKQYLLTGTAISFNGSLYRDDWGVKAVSFEPTITHKINDDLRIRLHYRIYRQSSADFYKSSYDKEEDIMTADKRLSAFISQVAGTSVTYSPNRLAERHWAITMGYNRYWENNNGLKANIFSITTKYIF
ncbi:MAG: DUF3570 domain-containing protein [Gammaproteobacteria bacterium]|nr:DUF3570 domain-containing protein [Gammaproteobacteria bacterium]